MNPDDYEDLFDDSSDGVLDDMFVDQYEISSLLDDIETVKQYKRSIHDEHM